MRTKPYIHVAGISLHKSGLRWFSSGICLFLILSWYGELSAQSLPQSPELIAESYFSEYLRCNREQNDSALYFIDQALKVGQEVNNDHIIARAKDYKGYYLFILKKEYQEAFPLFLDAYSLAKKIGDNKRMTTAAIHLAEHYNYTGELDSAVYYVSEAIRVRELNGDSTKLGLPYNNLATYFQSLERNGDAIEAYEKSAFYHLKNDNIRDYLNTSLNLAGLMIQEERYDKSREVLENLSPQICEGCAYEDIYLQRMGIVLMETGDDPERAKELLQQSYNLMSEKDEKHEFQAATLRKLAKISLEEGDISEYLEMMDKSINIAVEHNQLEQLRFNYLEFSRYHESVRDFENALHFHQLYITLKDSLIGSYTMNNVDKVLLQDLKLRSDRLIQEQQAAIQTKDRENQLMKIIGGLFLALILGGWRALHLINSKNQTIECQNEELKKYNTSLEEDVAHRTTELEETSKVLDNFIYRTSHDIRGPIASLKGLSNVARLEVKDPVARQYFDRIQKTADNMEYVLDGLREVNKVKYSAVSVQRFDLKQLILKSIELRKGQREGVGITFNNIDPVYLHSDPELTFSALDKIIDNAFKFHRMDARAPEVFIHAFKYNGGVKIKISDNGIGIDEEKVEYIFGLFERASDQSQFGGIGLYISKLALSKLGGDIKAERNYEKGLTIFEIYLPNIRSAE